MATSKIAKSTASKKVDNARKKTADDYEKMFQKMEKDPAPVLPKNFTLDMENRLKSDSTRRAGLVFLERPFKEMTNAFREDRTIAVSFADIVGRLPETIERYKGLVEVLETAKIRIEIALCVREDMPAIWKEVAQ